jgi:F-type H+-transporting ATPase subunit a
MKHRFLLLSILISVHMMTGQALAAGSGVELISYYKMLGLSVFGLSATSLQDWTPVIAASMTFSLLIVFGLIFKAKLNASGAEIAMPDRIGVRALFETILEFVFGLAESVIGKHQGIAFMPLLSTVFLFIFLSNTSGLVPGFPPATESMNTNLAIGLTVFLVYNACGIREHGFLKYLKHFMGPVWWLAPLFLTIELIGHAVRPISLSLRLYGNLFGDHLVMSVVTGLTGVVIPLVCYLFGTLVAVLQSLVFTLLSSIYISMAVAHDDH